MPPVIDNESLKKFCNVVIGFDNNFASPELSRHLVPFMRNGIHLQVEGHHITIPPGHMGVMAEVHLGAVIGNPTSEITVDKALDHVNGYVLALNNRTRLSAYARRDSALHEIFEFDTDVVVSSVISKSALPHPNAALFWMSVNNKESERGTLTEARCTLQECIAKASQLATLNYGDIVLSGSPVEAKYVKAGDTIEAGIEGLLRAEFTVERSTEVTTSVPSNENVF